MGLARASIAAAMFAALCCVPLASAQTSPIAQHYRAYVAALERGDLTTAATEAQAALDASQARDGDGGRTAVLAFNLANVHFQAGRYAEARPLAERALALAQAGAQGVDPLAAQFVIARSTLALGGEGRAGRDAAAALNALLTSPSAESLAVEDIYGAAAELGNWGLAHEDFEIAQSAWALAGAHAEGSPFGEAFGLGRARTSEGIAAVIAELRRNRLIDEDEGHDAHALLSEAVRVLLPLARQEAPTLELTVAQQTYAEATAWMSALESKLAADGRRVPDTPTEAQGDGDGFSEVGPVDLTRPRCMMRIIANPLPAYPSNSQVGSVVVFFRIGADGQIASGQVAARAGSEQFAEAVERVIGRWRFERIAESPANCRMESNVLQTVRFVMPN